MGLAIAIVCIGVLTYFMRLSFIGLAGRYRLPPLAERALRYVPPAALTALVVPDLVGHVGLGAAGDARLGAGLVAILVAWRARSIFLTLTLGLASLWLLTAALTR
jgi:branched-subunit amino acid transport protein